MYYLTGFVVKLIIESRFGYGEIFTAANYIVICRYLLFTSTPMYYLVGFVVKLFFASSRCSIVSEFALHHVVNLAIELQLGSS